MLKVKLKVLLRRGALEPGAVPDGASAVTQADGHGNESGDPASYWNDSNDNHVIFNELLFWESGQEASYASADQKCGDMFLASVMVHELYHFDDNYTLVLRAGPDGQLGDYWLTPSDELRWRLAEVHATLEQIFILDSFRGKFASQLTDAQLTELDRLRGDAVDYWSEHAAEVDRLTEAGVSEGN